MEVAARELQIGDKLILGLKGGGWHKLKNVKEGRELGWSLRFEGGVMGWVRGEEVRVEGEGGKLRVSEGVEEIVSVGGVSPTGSEISTESQREWKIPTGSMGKRREYTPARGDARGLFGDEEELLREMEREEKEMKEETKEGVEPVRKRPRFSMGRYRVIRGGEEDPPPSEANKGSSDAGDSQLEGPIETLSGHDKMDETPDSRVDMPPPSLPTASAIDPDQQQPHRSQEPPDSPELKPVDSSGLPLVSPLEHRGLNFPDYMMDNTPAMRAEPEITVSRPESAGYDSTGPNSLFDSPSPSPDPENRSRGRSPAVQPSPLRNVHTVGGELRRGLGMQSEQEDEGNKVPLLLPGKAVTARPLEEDAFLVEGNEGKDDTGREVSTTRGDGDEQGEEDHLMSVPHSTTRISDDVLTRGTTQSTTQTQSGNAPLSVASRGFQSGITTTVSTVCPYVCMGLYSH